MESCSHGAPLPDYDRVVVLPLSGQDFYSGAEALDLGSTDENHFDGSAAEKAFADGAVNLAAVGVAADGNVDCAQAGLGWIPDFFGQQNCAGAGAEAGLGVDERFKFFKSGFAEKLEESAGFSAGDDQAVNFIELLGLSDEHDVGAELLEPEAVGIEIALQGQDTDFHFSHQVSVIHHQGKSLVVRFYMDRFPALAETDCEGSFLSVKSVAIG
jgi:hypothetical protein